MTFLYSSKILQAYNLVQTIKWRCPLIHLDLVVNKKSPAKTAGQKDGISLGLLIPNGPLREASGPAPGYSAFDKQDAGKSSHTFPDTD